MGCGQKEPPVAQLPPAEVTVALPLTWEVTEDFEDIGQTASVEEVEIRARVSGYLVENLVADGALVNKDQELFKIDPSPYKAAYDAAAAEVKRWEATLAKTEADLKRNVKLVQTGAVSREDYELSAAQVAVSRAELEGGKAKVERANLDLGWTVVKAPFDGRIGKCNFDVGDLVPVGTADPATILTTILRVDQIWVYFNVPERTLLRYQQQVRESGRDARPDHIKDLKWPVYVGLPTGEGHPYQGILDFADNRVDPQTGTIRLRAILDNSQRVFTPGLFVRVRLPIGEPLPATLVPESAVGTDQGQKYLLAVDQEDVVQRVPVKLGRQLTLPGVDQSLRIVQEGLKAEQRVIVNGIQRARQGVKVAPKQVELPRPQAAAPTAPAEQTPASAPAPTVEEKPAEPTPSPAKESAATPAPTPEEKPAVAPAPPAEKQPSAAPAAEPAKPE